MNTGDFRTLILGLTGVSAVVGARMYPLLIPQEVWDSATEKPCLVYTISSEPTIRTFCGPDALEETGLELDCYARDYDTCKSLADTIRSEVENFKGDIGSTHFAPVYVVNAGDLFDPDPGLFRRVLTFTIWSAPL